MIRFRILAGYKINSFWLYFWSAITIDLRFRDLSPALVKLVEQGSTDETEAETLKIMNEAVLG